MAPERSTDCLGVYTRRNLCAIAAGAVAGVLAGTYLLTVQGLGILHDFIQDAQYYLRGHLTLQLCAFQLQVGVEL